MPDEKQILNAVKDALAADTTLAAYVKSFSVGDMEISRKIFPYISVGNINHSLATATMGSGGKDRVTYMFEIRGGVKHHRCEKAFSGEEGIMQLCEDIVSVAWPNDFGVFGSPAEIVAVRPAHISGTAGTLWIASVNLRGVCLVDRI